MSVDGIAAARWLAARDRLQHLGACLYYVWQAYKAQGASTGRSAHTALEAWNRTEGRHPGDRNPPAGVPVWFGAKPGSSAGDVVISLGDGQVVCTDYPSYGRVGTCTIAQRQAQIGRPYLGWSESIFDQRITYPAVSGGGNAAPKPTAPPQEEDMAIEDLHVEFRKTRGQAVPAAEVANLHINDKNEISVARGPAKHIAGNVVVQISGGVPYKGAVQVTPVVRTVVAGKTDALTSLRAREIVFTGGETFGEVAVNCALQGNQRLSFRIGGSSHDFIVVSATFRGMKLT